MNTLDITNERVKGKALHNLILDAVRDSQRVIIRPHYDELLMTQQQFDDLIKLKMSMLAQEDYLENYYIYNTGMSVMEVRVKEPVSAA